MPKFANFVQCTLPSPVSSIETSFTVEVESPYSLPPDPGGETAYVTLIDDLNNPTKFEIVSYTGVTAIDATSQSLTGVTRGQDGTVAQGWVAGTIVRQDIVSADLDFLRQPYSGVWIGSEDTSVRRFNLDGDLVWTNEDHDFAVKGLAVDSEGNSYSLSNDGTDNYKKINASGVTQWSKTVADPNVNFFDGVVKAGKDGYNYVCNGSSVFKYDDAGTLEWTYTPGWTDPIRNFDVDRDGNVFVAEDTVTGNVSRVLPDGSEYWAVNVTGGELVVAVSSGSNVWVGVGGGVRRLDYDGNSLGLTSGSLTGSVLGITALDDGTAIASYSGLGYEKFDAGGVSDWTGGAGGLVPAAIDLNGDVYSVLAPRVLVKLNGSDGSLNYSKSDLPLLGEPFVVAAAPVHDGEPVMILGGGSVGHRQLFWSEIGNKPQTVTEVIYAERAEPETPPTGKCIVYLDSADGNFKVKFDDGTVTTIATP